MLLLLTLIGLLIATNVQAASTGKPHIGFALPPS